MKESDLIVIGSGLPRTGTYSLKFALERLLGGRCYHSMSIILYKDNELLESWLGVLQNTGMDFREVRRVLSERGYVAAVDLPVANKYKDLMKVYPNAKVILTVRDPEAWYESIKVNIANPLHYLETWPYYYAWPYYMRLSRRPKVPTFVELSLFNVSKAFRNGKESAIQFYKAWISEVKESVPEDRLLVYDVRQGWEPLCEFLGKPVPDCAFPHVNDTKEMQSHIGMVRKIMDVLTYVTVACFIAVALMFVNMLL